MPDPSDALSDLDISDDAREKLRRFGERIETAGFNLVSTRDRSLIESRHIAESIAFGSLLAGRGLLRQNARVLDLGAGAGLPGISLKIVWPAIEMTLLDASAKKCRFMQDVARDLSIDVAVIEERAEALGHDPAHRETYDLVVARAVALLPVLTEYTLPFLRVGGTLAALKGQSIEAEVDSASAALRELGGTVVEVAPFQPPGGAAGSIVIIEKTSATPERYPRRTGIPSKRPIA